MGHSLAIFKPGGLPLQAKIYLQLILAAKEKPVFYNGISTDISIDHTSWEANDILYCASLDTLASWQWD